MRDHDEFAPVTPGEILEEEFLKGYSLARALGVSPDRIAEIVNNRRGITADTALRLPLFFGNSPEFWLNLQTSYDLKKPPLLMRLPSRVPYLRNRPI